jgi:hypothetical protein
LSYRRAPILCGEGLPEGRRSEIRYLVLIVCALPVVGCRSEPEAASTHEQACASACAAIVSAGCERPGLNRADHPRCVSACLERQALVAQAGCEAKRLDYLTCVGRAELACDRAQCAAAVCLEHASGLAACEREHRAFRSCIAPCEGAGTIHVGERSLEFTGRTRRIQAEVTRAGCAGCPKTLRPAAPPGSPCQTHTVCSEYCCRCPGSKAIYTARTCRHGLCVGEDEACALGRLASPSDPCP